MFVSNKFLLLFLSNCHMQKLRIIIHSLLRYFISQINQTSTSFLITISFILNFVNDFFSLQIVEFFNIPYSFYMHSFSGTLFFFFNKFNVVFLLNGDFLILFSTSEYGVSQVSSLIFSSSGL